MVKELCPAEKLPPIEIPRVDLPEPPDPFVSSDMDFVDHVRILRDRKDYTQGGIE
jgi:hypothetical protein